MITAVDILDEVEVEASALNGEVVRRAINGHCCNFYDHRHEFDGLLKYYIALRQRIHRLRIQLNDGYRSRYRDMSIIAENKLNRALREEIIMAAQARDKLKNYWPCAACIWLYNPTNRIRRFPSLIC